MLAQVFAFHAQTAANKPVQHAAGLRALGCRQTPACTGLQADGPDRHIRSRLRSPRLWRWRQGRIGPLQRPRHHSHRSLFAGVIRVLQARNAFVPQHGEVRFDHLVAGRQVQPDLKQLQRIGRIGVEQRKHFGVHDARACGHPLHITTAKARGSTQRIGVVNQALAHQRDGFKPPVRVTGKARHVLAVVHGKAIFVAEITAHGPVLQLHRLHAHAAVTGRVGIVVVSTEQKGVDTRPACAQRQGLDDGGCRHVSLLLGAAMPTPCGQTTCRVAIPQR